MKKRCLFNEKGVTLIELLASLLIFSIIIGLVSGILINSTNHFERTKNKISLSQEANLILAQITKAHQTTEEYTLASHNIENQTKQIKLNEEIISHPKLNIEILKIGQSDYNPFNNSTSINTRDPLFIELKVSDSKNNNISFTLKTIINRY